MLTRLWMARSVILLVLAFLPAFPTVAQEAARDATAPLTDRAERNLVALARLSGYIRFFHPSEEAAAANWDLLTIEACRGGEAVADDAALVEFLRTSFAGVAPSVQVWAGSKNDGPAPLAPGDGDAVIGWKHKGAGVIAPPAMAQHNIYKSERVRSTRGGEAAAGIRPLGARIEREIVPGFWCRVPVTVVVGPDNHTQPPGREWAMPMDMIQGGFQPSAEDRATRLAGVVLAWNVLQHFFPYFDVVGADWKAELPKALRSAATDKGAAEFGRTLRRMTAALKDGHVYVSWPGGAPPNSLPPMEFAGDDLIIAGDAAGDPVPLHAGDVVVSIDGRAVADILAELRPTISAATAGWMKSRLQGAVSQAPGPAQARLLVRRADGSEAMTVVRRATYPRARHAYSTPPNGSEVAPGIAYFDLNGTSNKQLEEAMPALVAAKGIVFDLRGYPGEAGYTLMGHLAERQITSAQWNVPLITMPDGEFDGFDTGGRWQVPPAEPHLGQPIVFLTYGGAISYAESVMGIVEAYKFGTIVGERTAGTNGNVNVISLPGGYSISFTGMKVLKHDGSPHHGVGIAPDVPVSPTAAGIAAGRDEVLEKGVEVLKAKLNTGEKPE